MSEQTPYPIAKSKFVVSDSRVLSTVETTACGKAILTGEHAVVYGAHAVAIPLPDMRFRFRLQKKTSRLNTQPEIHLKLAGHEGSPRLKAVLLKAMELLKIPPFSLDAETHSTLPIGAGLGSSATLCVAVLRAFSKAYGIYLDDGTLAAYANELEKSFHGNPSGLDAATVSFEKPVLFAKGKPITPVIIAPDFPLHFVLIDSNIRASTLAMIRIAEPYFKGAEGQSRIERFDAISLATYKALTEGCFETLAQSMSECGRLLTEAGVVPANLQDMIARSERLGVVGAKSTGAGGGGMMMGLLPRDPKSREHCLKSLQAEFKDHLVTAVSL